MDIETINARKIAYAYRCHYSMKSIHSSIENGNNEGSVHNTERSNGNILPLLEKRDTPTITRKAG